MFVASVEEIIPLIIEHLCVFECIIQNYIVPLFCMFTLVTMLNVTIENKPSKQVRGK